MDRTNWGVLVGAVAAFTIGLIGGCAPTAPLDEPDMTEAALTNCGNGVCETGNPGETCASCPGDCGRCAGDHCGDGVCKKKETCVTCELDCGACSGCGNGVCEGSETCANCPLDCASCSKEFCGNGVCGRRESCTACARDCCPQPQCTMASDCPATGNECVSRTCVSGQCGTANVPEGNPTSMQVSGDCKTMVCNGSGGTEQVSAPDDFPPDDMNSCTEAACTDGVPSQQPTPAGTSCGGSNVCDGAGNCVGCVSNMDCTQPMGGCSAAVCTMGVCTTNYFSQGSPSTNQTSGDCQTVICDGMGGTMSSINDMDIPNDGNECTTDLCTMGVPSHEDAPIIQPCSVGGMAGTCSGGMCQPL